MNNYGIPDPGLQNPGDFGNAATNVYSPQSPAASAPVAQGDSKYEDVAGKGWRVKLPNGGYRMLNEHEYRGLQITPAGDQARVLAIQERKDKEKIKAENEGKQDILNARYEKEFGLKLAELQSQIAQVNNAHKTGLAQIGLQGEQVKNQGKQIDAQAKLGLGQLDETKNARIDANTHRTEELGLTRQQMQLNNQLQQAKLLQESQQFERQHALDEKNNRRTQVMGALTLIAQSAAKF